MTRASATTLRLRKKMRVCSSVLARPANCAFLWRVFRLSASACRLLRSRDLLGSGASFSEAASSRCTTTSAYLDHQWNCCISHTPTQYKKRIYSTTG